MPRSAENGKMNANRKTGADMHQKEFDDLAAKAKENLGLEIPPERARASVLPYREKLLREMIADAEASGVRMAALYEAHAPIARRAIVGGEGAAALEGGFGWDSPEERLRSFSMAKALADEAVRSLEQEPAGFGDPEGIMPRFADALLALPQQALGFGLDRLKIELAERIPSISRIGDGGRFLGIDIKTGILHSFAEHPGCSGESRTIAIRAMADMDKFRGAEEAMETARPRANGPR